MPCLLSGFFRAKRKLFEEKNTLFFKKNGKKFRRKKTISFRDFRHKNNTLFSFKQQYKNCSEQKKISFKLKYYKYLEDKIIVYDRKIKSNFSFPTFQACQQPVCHPLSAFPIRPHQASPDLGWALTGSPLTSWRLKGSGCCPGSRTAPTTPATSSGSGPPWNAAATTARTWTTGNTFTAPSSCAKTK